MGNLGAGTIFFHTFVQLHSTKETHLTSGQSIHPLMHISCISYTSMLDQCINTHMLLDKTIHASKICIHTLMYSIKRVIHYHQLWFIFS